VSESLSNRYARWAKVNSSGGRKGFPSFLSSGGDEAFLAICCSTSVVAAFAVASAAVMEAVVADVGGKVFSG
jgi:hypothetical protein